MSKTREDKQAIVCTTATGCVEGDMLGQILLFVERKNRPGPHGFHREKTVRMSYKSKLRVAVKRSWRALLSGLRRFKSIPGKGKDDTPKYLSGVRKQKRNGN